MTSTLRTTVLLLTALAVLGCSAKPASTAQIDASDPSQAQSASPKGASASWSATIDGAEVSGNGVDEIQLGNAAFVLGGPGKKYNGQRYGFFTLYATPDGQLDKANLTMTFHFPPHAGTFVHAGTFDSCNCDMWLAKNVKVGDLAQFNADTVTITITSMSATRITGTFSGSYKLSNDTPRSAQKRATVTNGKFDLPMSASKLTPE
ncbi:MAG TPA: hypothetical protein VJR24_08250 [Gemmatimonadaceae bacterium]|nr:hypothetical protein [Gemmatimonadaceae bacterium]